MGIAVGIDLGTTYSAVGRIDPTTGHAVIIRNPEGEAVTPSVVAVMPGGKTLIGAEAKEQQELGYTETAAFFKRSMGQKDFSLTLCGSQYSASDLAGILLRGLVQQAQEVSGETIDAAVVTVPAYFKNSEREATLEAASKAGLKVLGLLNEPTAAVFAYGLNADGASRKVLVYDLGGGTFDVTLAQVDGEEIRVLGSDGSHMLGGKDWDDALVRWITDQFSDEFDVDLSDDSEQMGQLAVVAEKAKKRLSRANSAPIRVSYQGHTGKYELTRDEFDDITSFMLQETSDIVDRLFASMDPPVSWQDVDGAILVGGSTRMKQVHDYIERMSGKPPLGGVNVDEAVALGAAIRANQNASGAPTMLLGSGSSASPSDGPNMLLGGRKVTDVTSHSLGMIAESSDRSRYINDILIPKNSPIPARQTQRRELRVPTSGGELEVYLLQGQEPAPLDNEVAAKYVFTDIPYVGDGRTLIDVTYSYDENGVIAISAVQTETNTSLPMHREPVPEDMSWATRSPLENDQVEQTANPGIPSTGEIYIFIDMSGSMHHSISDATRAAQRFVDQTNVKSMHIGIVGFATSHKIYQEATNRKRQLKNSLIKLKQNFELYEVGGGNADDPLSYLESLFSDYGTYKLALILTDGIWEDSEEAVQCAHSVWEHGINTIGIGIGGADEDFLKQISSIQDLSELTDASHLVESFSKIARVISSGDGLVR